jgi:actin-like ATPase involved in cell morphogenesis
VPVADLIAAVLHRVAGEAARAAGGAPTDIVLTCPAGWATGRRDLLRQAAATALPGARLVEEPVAAANHFIAVGGDLSVGDTAVVYDFGAGTFDASVLRRTASGIEVLATECLNDCGGLDIDAAIVESLGAVLREKPGWNRLVEPKTTADRRASRQLWDNVRQAKEMLSRAATTLVHVPLVDVEVPIGREELDAAAAPVLEQTVTAVRAALRTAGIEGAGAIFLCGGSSRMPVVTTVLHRAFGIEPTVVDQPELAVAEGSIQSPAAIAAPVPADPSWPTVDLTKRPAASPGGSAAPHRGRGRRRAAVRGGGHVRRRFSKAIGRRGARRRVGRCFGVGAGALAHAFGELRAGGGPVPRRHVADGEQHPHQHDRRAQGAVRAGGRSQDEHLQRRRHRRRGVRPGGRRGHGQREQVGGDHPRLGERPLPGRRRQHHLHVVGARRHVGAAPQRQPQQRRLAEHEHRARVVRL